MSIQDIFANIPQYRPLPDYTPADRKKINANKAAYDEYQAAYDVYEKAFNAGNKNAPAPSLNMPYPEADSQEFMDAAQKRAQSYSSGFSNIMTHIADPNYLAREYNVNISPFHFEQGGAVPTGWMQGVGSLFQKFINR